jgi:amidohydrolase
VSILMGVASILTDIQDELSGSVVFIFQPAEEGAPAGEGGGAEMMVDEGVIRDHNVDVVFGLHVNSLTEVGKIRYKPGGTMAAADQFEITVHGKQSHGSRPWGGVDPIVIGSQIVMGLQTIVSRQTELTKEAAVITVGKFDAGVRNNIIPEKATLIGTIRTLDTKMQDIIHAKIKKTAELIAQAGGATAEVKINRGYPVTFNNIELTRQMLPTLNKCAGEENVIITPAVTGAEDFSFFANEVPGLFFFLGGMPKGMSQFDAGGHHTPDFFIDESGLELGVRTLCNLTVDYMAQNTGN